MTDRTDAELAQDYAAMGDSIALITDVIAGNAVADDLAADSQGCVGRIGALL